MAIGYLTIQAGTARDAIPLAGVRIRILDDEGRSVYELTTDESGEAALVSLETVGRELSLDPYYGGTAYISYDVFAQTAGFHPIHITGIPIYEGETAVLPLLFVPLSEGQRSTDATEIAIGKPAASMREARYQEAPVEEPRVLRQVIIPNPITVHLGRPAVYASNVQVSFPDYVKNVASSEIYPTWPEASLRANIYAIITFALNRVFTEWYRNHH
ncbi:MAG: carboxypeptidase-like regulatory domain-containing protein [Blautia sp.]|nr:carboxypeptidase-like regulatory domain-containing protein [Blautia sp.]MCM1201229.1 carboxypeptidase-like regulatory domain-containing protein [Bacteroides fragilis]